MRLALVLCAVAALSCAAPAGVAFAPSHAARERSATLEYSFALDAELRIFSARMCPDGALPKRLVPGMHEARGLLKRVTIERDGQEIELPIGGDGVQLRGLEPGECVRYELDLDAAHAGMGAPMARHSGASLIANIAALLWRPAAYDRYEQAHARFQLPEGVSLSVPWPRVAGDPDRYTLDASAFAFQAYAAFGRIDVRQLHVAGSSLELAILDGLSEPQHGAIERWVSVQARAVASLGRLPREHLQLVVVPSGPSSDPMRFGSMTRGGGASVALLIASDFDEDALTRDWVLVHEICHLLHPFVVRGQAWLSEGIATYYQEVLRARAGLESREQAWRRIWDGSRQGEAMPGNLEHGAATMYETYRFAPVYWGGASIMLLADVELRRRSHGERGLDDVLMELSSCCSKGSRPWSAGEVAQRIDAIAGFPLMHDLIANVVQGASYPRLDGLFGQLGLDEQGRAQAGAPLSEIRDAIMSARSAEPSLQLSDAGGTNRP